MLDSFIGGPCVGFVLTRSTPLMKQFWKAAWDIGDAQGVSFSDAQISQTQLTLDQLRSING